MEIPSAEISSTQHDRLVRQSRIWVAQTFFGEMLKQMRNSPFKSELFSGGRAGEMFASQLDERIAERMAGTGAGKRMVDSIVKHIERNMKRPHVTPTDRP